MSDFTTEGENDALTNLDSTVTHLALFTADPGEGGSLANELTSGTAPGYARQPISFGAPSNGQMLSTNKQDFTNSGGGDWPAVTHVALATALTAGSLKKRTAITSATVTPGSTLSFPVGDIDANVD